MEPEKKASWQSRAPKKKSNTPIIFRSGSNIPLNKNPEYYESIMNSIVEHNIKRKAEGGISDMPYEDLSDYSRASALKKIAEGSPNKNISLQFHSLLEKGFENFGVTKRGMKYGVRRK
jgi:hypothetical protein